MNNVASCLDLFIRLVYQTCDPVVLSFTFHQTECVGGSVSGTRGRDNTNNGGDALMMLETGCWSRTTGSDDLMDMGQLSSLLDTDLDPANTPANSGG